MTTLLVRPYPVNRVPEARAALEAAGRGDLGPMQALYRAAAEALAAIDPDEVADARDEHRRALRDDVALARAAHAVHDTWEGIVAVGSVLSPRLFRGFSHLVAHVRYELGPNADAIRLRAYAAGAALPDLEPRDAALYVALPALIGLGPELPEELAGPCPFPGEPLARALGLPADDDWSGVDPLDGILVDPATCRALYAAAPMKWREVVGRALETGLLVRPDDGAEAGP